MSKDKTPSETSPMPHGEGEQSRRPGPTMKPLSEWTFAGVGRHLVKLPLSIGLLLILLSPFAQDGGEQLGSGFLVVMASLVIGAFFQLVDDRSR